MSKLICDGLTCEAFRHDGAICANNACDYYEGFRKPPLAYDYGWDVGNLHVIDYRLWLADIPIRRFAESPRSLHTSPADWSR